jgi:hypothetical protein
MKRNEALLQACRAFMDRMNKWGTWDEGCFYYGGVAASELVEPMKLAIAAIKAAEEEES